MRTTIFYPNGESKGINQKHKKTNKSSQTSHDQNVKTSKSSQTSHEQNVKTKKHQSNLNTSHISKEISKADKDFNNMWNKNMTKENKNKIHELENQNNNQQVAKIMYKPDMQKQNDKPASQSKEKQKSKVRLIDKIKNLFKKK